MTEFSEAVERQAKLLLAEEWAKGVESIHVHRLKSMWYETRPQDTDNGSVMDKTYHDGTIERILPDGGIVYLTDERLEGDELISKWERVQNDRN
tara:strand:+ start:1640 stop:1921 length:282 start_codon:yes stop_codon:yes gene_type:complete